MRCADFCMCYVQMYARVICITITAVARGLLHIIPTGSATLSAMAWLIGALLSKQVFVKAYVIAKDLDYVKTQFALEIVGVMMTDMTMTMIEQRT